MSSEQHTWYVARQGRPYGPITDAEMRKSLEQGQFLSTDLVWRPGFSDWRPITSEFQDVALHLRLPGNQFAEKKVGDKPKPNMFVAGVMRRQLLTWFGLVGGSITLFSNISGLLLLADWARWIVVNWRAWTHGFWQQLFGWLHIRLQPVWSPLLTFIAFVALICVGLRWAERMRVLDSESTRRSDEPNITAGFGKILAVLGHKLIN